MKTIIIDCHKEVLPYWFKEYLKLQRPLVGIRIDQHHDMNHECPALPSREGRPILDYFVKMIPFLIGNSRRKINEANFTCLAFHYGIIGTLYHFNPRAKEIDAYGRVSGLEFINAPRTKKEAALICGKRRNRIFWDEAQTKLRIQGGKPIPVPQKITIEELRRDLEESCFPSVIDFDLDGLYGIEDGGPKEEIVARRLERVKNFLECVLSPSFACIARSQTPRRYVPREIVDGLQDAATNLIQTI